MNDIDCEDPHLFAIYYANLAALEVSEALPECDLVVQLEELLCVQQELIEHLFEGKHYGSDRLKSFVEYTNNLKYEMRKLKDAVEEGKE